MNFYSYIPYLQLVVPPETGHNNSSITYTAESMIVLPRGYEISKTFEIRHEGDNLFYAVVEVVQNEDFNDEENGFNQQFREFLFTVDLPSGSGGTYPPVLPNHYIEVRVMNVSTGVTKKSRMRLQDAEVGSDPNVHLRKG